VTNPFISPGRTPVILDGVNQDISGTGNPLLDGVTRAWDLLIQQIDEILGWVPPPPAPGLRKPSAMSDGDLRAALRAVATGLIGTIDAARRAGGPAPGDPRWRFNLPAAVETLVPAMFAEASDAFSLAVTGLDDQASAASLGAVGHLAETLARARWLLEPSDAGQRRERGYALADEAISRVMELSGRAWEAGHVDHADLAGEIADRAGTMAERLAELRAADGLDAVRVPKRRKLLQAYLPEGVELFALMSAADSRPVATASGLFYTEPGTGDALRGFQRQHLTRAYWLAQAVTLYADASTVCGTVMGRPGWTESVATAAARFRPLCEEAGRRYRQRLERGLHPGL
jgi:hypothetical protein